MATFVKSTHRPPPRGRAEITDAVLDAAEKLFARGGPSDTSLREIADEAGVTYSLINRHFGTKESLIAALLDRYAKRWAPRLSVDAPLAERVALLLDADGSESTYLRLLAFHLLSDDATKHAQQAVLDRLLPESPTAEDRAQIASVLSLVLGWRFFSTFIAAALKVPETELPQVQLAVETAVRSLATPKS